MFDLSVNVSLLLYPLTLFPSVFIITSPRPRGVQNFRFVVLKKKDNINKDDDSGILSFLSGLLENFFFLALAAAVVMWCSRKHYLGGHKRRIRRDYYHEA